MKARILLLTLPFLIACHSSQPLPAAGRWSQERAAAWYAAQPWLVGANYTPATAVNPIEMWQAATWDPGTIDKELGWAADLGFNTMRVFLSDVVWRENSAEYLARLDDYLAISARHNIRTMFVLFDAVWNPVARPGPQPEPVPHRHNSQWVQCPAADLLADTLRWNELESYFKGIMTRFAADERVVIWDIYNEPDNDNFGKYPDTELTDKRDYTFRLLSQAFQWSREVNPSQPITAGVWWGDWSSLEKMSRFDRLMVSQSDLISFHSYDGPELFTQRSGMLKTFGRPLLCTEYMARPNGSTFPAILPLMQRDRMGAWNWGFVAGRSQTIYPWDSWQQSYTAEPEVWFHDVFRPDGTPYDRSEVELIRRLTGAGPQP